MKSTTLAARTGFSFAQPLRSAAASNMRGAPVDTDEAIRKTLLVRLENAPWWDARTSNVFVDRGKVVYQGLLKHESDRPAARQAALELLGVHDVWDARLPRREWQALA
ncbi:MAG: BON domain-containing protein [Pseudomonadota bacterium]